MANPIIYAIVFVHPSVTGVEVDYHASGPFQPINVGDEVWGATWRGSQAPYTSEHNNTVVAKVTSIARSISADGAEVVDTVIVYTEPAGLLADEQRKRKTREAWKAWST